MKKSISFPYEFTLLLTIFHVINHIPSGIVKFNKPPEKFCNNCLMHVLLFLPRATVMIVDDVSFVRTYCFQLLKPQSNFLQVFVNHTLMGGATSPTNVLLLISLDKFYQLFTTNSHGLSLRSKMWYHVLCSFLLVCLYLFHFSILDIFKNRVELTIYHLT